MNQVSKCVGRFPTPPHTYMLSKHHTPTLFPLSANTLFSLVCNVGVWLDLNSCSRIATARIPSLRKVMLSVVFLLSGGPHVTTTHDTLNQQRSPDLSKRVHLGSPFPEPIHLSVGLGVKRLPVSWTFCQTVRIQSPFELYSSLCMPCSCHLYVVIGNIVMMAAPAERPTSEKNTVKVMHRVKYYKIDII